MTEQTSIFELILNDIISTGQVICVCELEGDFIGLIKNVWKLSSAVFF